MIAAANSHPNAPDGRLDRVAELLATAILRLALRRQKELEECRQVEAPCGEPVRAKESAAAKESA